jgi:hypothetical protein
MIFGDYFKALNAKLGVENRRISLLEDHVLAAHPQDTSKNVTHVLSFKI